MAAAQFVLCADLRASGPIHGHARSLFIGQSKLPVASSQDPRWLL